MLINPSSNSNKTKLAIGLMSGTSLDGVDATLLSSDGGQDFKIIDNLYLPYSGEFVEQLRDILFSDVVSIARVAEIQYSLTLLHIDAIDDLLQKAGHKLSDIDIIGMHGQTLYHAPEIATSWQLGLPDLVAQHVGCPVVFNFRNRDIACKGQGAPLVPVFHQALLQQSNLSNNAAILNIGGIANITISQQGNLIASDVGPGNQLINDLCAEHFNIDYDHEGQIAAKNSFDHIIIDQILNDPFFTREAPKSLDRSYFSRYKEYFLPLTPGVAVATATHLTAQAILSFLSNLSEMPEMIFLSGGGSKNKYLVSLLESLLGEVVQIKTIESLGYESNFIESAAFAYLAIRTMHGLDSTYPSTTGGQKPSIAGDVIHP